jgi:hypothetical protein
MVLCLQVFRPKRILDITSVMIAPGRYHYNVANTRVDQHVEKGNDDGLYISSVACCQELWALIMDAGEQLFQGLNISSHVSNRLFLDHEKRSSLYVLFWSSSVFRSAVIGTMGN